MATGKIIELIYIDQAINRFIAYCDRPTDKYTR